MKKTQTLKMLLLAALAVAMCLLLAASALAASLGPTSPPGGSAGESTELAPLGTVLWDQPSYDGWAAVLSEQLTDNPVNSLLCADDFVNSVAWSIDTIFTPGSSGLGSLSSATSLTWQIYADAAGKPAGDPSGGGSAPVWTLTLSPADPQVSITDSGADATLALSTPIQLPAGHWWLVFYATANSNIVWHWWEVSGCTNGSLGQWINPGGGWGYGTAWHNWVPDIGPYPTDLAFRLEGSVGEPRINEFSTDTTGTDVEYVEFYGAPDTDYSDYTLLEMEGDYGADGSQMGTVDEVLDLGTTDAAGFYLASLPPNSLENGTMTLLLVKDFTGTLGADLDTNGDGTLDVSPWGSVVDAVAVNDGNIFDRTYGVPALGVAYDGLPLKPGGASRIPDGYDTDAATDWVRNDFDGAGLPGYTGTITTGEAYNTPGESNAAFIPNSPPVAGDDESLDNFPGPVTLDVLCNDTDPDGNLDTASVDLDPCTGAIDKTYVACGEGTWTEDGAGNVTFTPEAGFFGDPTPISYTVSDTCGLYDYGLITITYLRASDLKQEAWDALDALYGTLSGSQKTYIGMAKTSLGWALNPTYWIDDLHLKEAYGSSVFTYERQCLTYIRSAVTYYGLSPCDVDEIIAALVAADRLLACQAIADAIDASGSASKIATAQGYLAKADAYAAVSNWDYAVANYRNAWFYAVSAY